ncbi:dash complex subunit duo1 protein [Rutstroemia sp. NJR-2017a BVV2]|nr:dash complex subunit duo1 protein [Rutstroemia sp. NJR-2017a BVV2]
MDLRRKQTVSRTVTSASTLLNTWTRILSQTEHNQRLILNPNWRGATQDIIDMENETVLKAQAAERRAAEEERRREDARRRADDEERQRQAGTATRGTRGGRGRGRGGLARTGSVNSSGYGQSSIGRGGSTGPGRTGSGIGRGIPRGRARGVR